ncbi:SpoIIE family protein phosphatase [Streptomyces sp. Caat 7-52]|uniref:SpoIIE family protein phosphatase n=1 Tax=Streptomyces sp. Caat 7-52 TaxID=2949637 RepID=UPI0020354603|nr:SpoIIE family protein phosphatase [Streptomyces sp. Caat 7-52]
MVDTDETAGTGDAGTATLDALFTQAPVGLAVLDSELRVVRINTATPAMQGMREEEVVGRRFPASHHVVDGAAAEALARQVLETGVPVRERIVRARPPAHGGQERLYEVSAFRLLDRGGAVLGLSITVVDVTERERAQARLAVLDKVRERVGGTLDMVATCQELADALVPAFADVAVVELVDAVIAGDEPPPTPNLSRLTLRRAAFRSAAGEDQPQAHPLGHVGILPFPSPYSLALGERRPVTVSIASEAAWLDADPDRARAIRASGVRTLLAVPLTVRDAVVGLVSLYRTAQGSPYDDNDVLLARDFARHAALCIDNARRYARAHSVAATVLRHMPPSHVASQTALEVEGMARPGEDESAWYDTIPLSGARTALVAGAVSGGGIRATAAMGQLRTVIHTLAALGLEPADLLARLNDTVKFLLTERGPSAPGSRTLTAGCVYAVYDPLTTVCTIARAGHPGPVIAHPDGTVDQPEIPSGPRLGSPDDAPFAATEIRVPSGSVVAFPATAALTAQLTNATSLLRKGPSLADVMLHELCDDLLCALPPDAVAGGAVLLLARTRAFPADRVATCPLDNVLTAAASARGFTVDKLSGWSVAAETAFNAELIVSELVTNAVRYGSPPLELRLILDRTLTCEVSDAGASAPHLRHARTTDEGGRGLFIVAQLAEAWGARYSAEAKTIWTEQALEPT